MRRPLEDNPARWPTNPGAWEPLADKLTRAPLSESYPFRLQHDVDCAKLGPKEFAGFTTAAAAVEYVCWFRQRYPKASHCFYETIKVCFLRSS